MDVERRKGLDPILGEAEQDLMTLVDLQRFLAEELSDSVDFSTDFSKSFTPLSEGLGIHQAKPKAVDSLMRFPAELPRTFQQVEPLPTPPPIDEQQAAVEDLLDQHPLPRATAPVAAPTQAKAVTRFVDESVIEEEFESRTDNGAVSSFRVKDNRLKHALGEREDASTSLPRLDDERTQSVPPPLPKAGLLRRSMAALMDQVFVWTLAVLTLVFVTNVLSSGSAQISGKLLKEFTRPEFAKYLVGGFAAIWFCYLTLSVGVLESTFGMWIWGMRINYGREQRFFKKVARVGLSFLFLPAVLPGLLLAYQRQGKNLIDSLSGTDVFRTT